MKVNNWLHTPCFAPFDDDDSSGGSGFEPYVDDDDKDEVIDGEEEEDDNDSSDDDDDDDKPAASAFDGDALARAITQGLQPVLQQQQPKLTREEIERQLGKPNPSVDLIKMIRDPETAPEKALEALATLMNSQNEYLLKASGMAIDGRVQELNPQIEALKQHQRKAIEKDFVSSVVRKFPALKGKGPAITQAVQLLSKQGYQMKSESGARRDVANVAARLIKQFDTNFSLKPKAQQTTQFMRPGSGSGRSGGGGKKSIIDSIFSVK